MVSSTLFRGPIVSSIRKSIRALSTLPNNPHIYIFPSRSSPSSHILSLLPTNPPTESLTIGTTTAIPPTPTSLTENHRFLTILQSVLKEHAHSDPWVRSQALAFATSSGSQLGQGGVFTQQQHRRGSKSSSSEVKSGGDGAGGASHQGGAGGAGRGGWVHVSDLRAPPDYGRIAWPEDIFGSLEVDGQGQFVDGDGNYQSSGTYRVVTREGILGLTDFLREKLVERLKEEEKKERAGN
ncbi:hypothetical protein F5884DRAFT_292993 [Xylogone sp. PMI_703]|nr:hypothetical protein F5884DRAFT_292993 [Xylogone sp. PMI_703]